MKYFFASIALAIAVLRASAQVSVELVLDQEQFLPSESLPVAVKITNRSGQQLHLGAEAVRFHHSSDRLTGLELADGSVVPAQVAVVAIGVRPELSLARDAAIASYADLASARVGDACPRCRARMRGKRGIEVAESRGDKQAAKEMQVFAKRLEKNFGSGGS